MKKQFVLGGEWPIMSLSRADVSYMIRNMRAGAFAEALRKTDAGYTINGRLMWVII